MRDLTKTYFSGSVILPVMMYLVIIITAVFLSKMLAKCKKPTFMVFLPFGIAGVLVCLSLACFADSYSYPLSVILEPNAVRQTTVGEITSVQQAEVLPIYYDDKQKAFIPASFIVVDGCQYYVPCGGIEVGANITFVWATDKRVVLSWKLSDPNEADSLGTPITPKEESVDWVRLGNKVRSISFLLLFLVVLLQYPIGKVLNAYFRNIDAAFHSEVVPNRWGLLYVVILFTPIYGVLLGWWLTGASGAMLIILISMTVLAGAVIRKQSTKICIDEGKLEITRIGSTMSLNESDILRVQWGKSHLPYNRALVIFLKSGIILSFEQENYWGLDYLYDQISGSAD